MMISLSPTEVSGLQPPYAGAIGAFPKAVERQQAALARNLRFATSSPSKLGALLCKAIKT